MRTIVPLFAALLLLHASLASAQSASATNTPLVGSWKSATDRLTLSTAFDESVWGKNAASVRDVELTVPSTGPATLTVTRKVVDAKGKTVPGSTSIEQARIQITGAASSAEPRTDYKVEVVSAERRYPDPPATTSVLTGVRVTLAAVTSDEGQMLEVRFDTPEGRGSFWDTLRRSSQNSRSSR